MKRLILMRGLPGSGKSAEATMLAIEHLTASGQTVAICSTDNFHMESDKYVFKPNKLNEFHVKNQFFARAFMLLGVELVIIDNTNIKRQDMQPYIDAAKERRYEIEEIIIDKPIFQNDDPLELESYIQTCFARNTHDVPREAIEKMAKKFEL